MNRPIIIIQTNKGKIKEIISTVGATVLVIDHDETITHTTHELMHDELRVEDILNKHIRLPYFKEGDLI